MEAQAIGDAARGLFGICVAVAAMEQLTGKGASSRPFRSLCALAAMLCAMRLAVGLL